MARQWQVTVDCADPMRLCRFWASALGYVEEPAPEGFDTWLDYWLSLGIPAEELEGAEEGSGAIIDPDGVGPRIWFQEVPEPKQVKNRLHLDVNVSGGRTVPLAERRTRIDDAVGRLVTDGASVLRTNAPEGADFYAVVMQDPEGNEFCVH